MKTGLYQRRYITLLELLIVIAILALVGGLIGIGINRALINQRFRAEVALVVDQLRLAQDLMLILGTDVRLKFSEDPEKGKGIKYELELETLLPARIEAQILRRRGNLKTIKGVFFQDVLAKEHEKGKIEVRFQSKGAVMSRGLMRLATTDDKNPPANALQTYIALPGYPRSIFNEDDGEKASRDYKEAIDSIDDTKVTDDTFSKLPELFKDLGNEGKEEKSKSEDNKSVESQGSEQNPSEAKPTNPAKRRTKKSS